MQLGSAHLGVEWFRCSYCSPAREADGIEQHRRLRHGSIMKVSVVPITKPVIGRTREEVADAESAARSD
jgi:hypothetical protein